MQVTELQSLLPYAPALARELFEAASGVRIARIEVPQASLDKTLSWATSRGFQVAYGAAFYTAIDTGMEYWSSEAIPSDSQNPAALCSVFLGFDRREVKEACYADEASDHDRLGSFLGIPKCCRRKFEDGIQTVGTSVDPLFWLTVPDPAQLHESTINPFARYAGAGLMSFYPCSPSCSRSNREIRKRLETTSRCFPRLAHSLLWYENCSGFYARGLGVALYRPLGYANDGSLLNKCVYIQGTNLRELAKSGKTLMIVGSSLFIEKYKYQSDVVFQWRSMEARAFSRLTLTFPSEVGCSCRF